MGLAEQGRPGPVLAKPGKPGPKDQSRAFTPSFIALELSSSVVLQPLSNTGTIVNCQQLSLAQIHLGNVATTGLIPNTGPWALSLVWVPTCVLIWAEGELLPASAPRVLHSRHHP